MSIRSQIIIVGLQKIFNKRHFSICDVRELAKLFGNNDLPKEYEVEFHVLHCMDFSSMPRSLRDALPARVIEACAACAPYGAKVNEKLILSEFLKAQGCFFEEEPVLETASREKKSEPEQREGQTFDGEAEEESTPSLWKRTLRLVHRA